MTMSADDRPVTYRFADLTLDVARRCVTRDGGAVELKALDYDLLRVLVESAPNVVNADVLAEKVWGRHFVSPENVAQRVMLLRQSLSDDANKPRYIETIRNKGYRLIPFVEYVDAAPPRAAARRRLSMAHIAASVLAAVGVTVSAAYWLVGPAERATPSPTSIAVLPFENSSPDPADAYFAAGMGDEISSQLTKLRGFSVISVQPGTGAQRPLADVLRDLNVATVLSGSVYYSQGRVRVTPRLVQAGTGVLLWLESYERDLSDIFAIQSEIALDVARELSVELSIAERQRVERVPTTDPQARHLYLSARARDPTSTQVLIAIDELEQAIALDSNFAEAWLLNSVSRTGWAAFVDPEHADEHLRRGEVAARRVLELDPQSGDAHAALALVLLGKRDWTGAEENFRRAISLNTPLSRLGSYAFLRLSAGKIDALPRDIFEETLAAEPQNGLFYRFLAFVHEALGEVAEANRFYESSKRLFPTETRETVAMLEQKMHWLVGRKELAAASGLTVTEPLNAAMLTSFGTPEQALIELRRSYASVRPGNPNFSRTIGLWAGHFDDPNLALEAMRTAIDEQSSQTAYLWLPQLTEMRRLPEFKTYMREIGMVAYWQEYGWPPFCEAIPPHDFECH
jgi:TolB-like protein/DNA-binding winged helix-turn-helix (wHTH) protein